MDLVDSRILLPTVLKQLVLNFETTGTQLPFTLLSYHGRYMIVSDMAQVQAVLFASFVALN